MGDHTYEAVSVGTLQNTHIEGLGDLMLRFTNILEEVRRKPYDLLDTSRTIFDRDFLEFNVHISDLESSIQVRMLQQSRKKICCSQSVSDSALYQCRHTYKPHIHKCIWWRSWQNMQAFIAVSFSHTNSTLAALQLLAHFQSVLQRGTFKADLARMYKVGDIPW